MANSERVPPPPVAVVVKGDVGDEAVRYAESKITRLIESVAEPVLFCRVKLTHEPDPARPRPARAQVSLEVNGQPLRAQVVAHSFPEAVDLVHDRLRDTLEHRAEHYRRLHRETGVAEAGEWRHGSLPAERADYFDRPVDDRQIVRHKTFAIEDMEAEEAAFDMEMLDYDFYLFRELGTGSDAVIEREDGGGPVLHRSGAGTPGDVGPASRYAVSAEPVPTMTADDALERLNVSGDRYVFFVNASTGRGNVLYHRYDGHYGLIEPANHSKEHSTREAVA